MKKALFFSAVVFCCATAHTTYRQVISQLQNTERLFSMVCSKQTQEFTLSSLEELINTYEKTGFATLHKDKQPLFLKALVLGPQEDCASSPCAHTPTSSYPNGPDAYHAHEARIKKIIPCFRKILGTSIINDSQENYVFHNKNEGLSFTNHILVRALQAFISPSIISLYREKTNRHQQAISLTNEKFEIKTNNIQIFISLLEKKAIQEMIVFNRTLATPSSTPIDLKEKNLHRLAFLYYLSLRA